MADFITPTLPLLELAMTASNNEISLQLTLIGNVKASNDRTRNNKRSNIGSVSNFARRHISDLIHSIILYFYPHRLQPTLVSRSFMHRDDICDQKVISSMKLADISEAKIISNKCRSAKLAACEERRSHAERFKLH